MSTSNNEEIFAAWDVYREGWQISDSLSTENEKRQIFHVSVLGFQTHRDDFAIGFEEKDIRGRISELRDKHLSDETVAAKNFPPPSNESSQKRSERLKGRTLSLDESNHVADVADSLAFTIAQMEKIDAAYRVAFPAVDN